MTREVLVGPLTYERPELELAFAHALVLRAGRGELDEVVRVYRPLRSMVVFGRRDTRRPGFRDAVEMCRAAGFETAVRATGGRAVAYTARSIVVDHVKREPGASALQDHRFVTFGQAFAELLKRHGVDARLGPVPGEYCPGAHSVNARGQAKLVGTAQRVIRDAWLFSSLVVLDDASELRPLLAKVYGALEIPFDEASVGAVADESPRAGVQLERALIDELAPAATLRPSSVDTATLALARGLLSHHRVA